MAGNWVLWFLAIGELVVMYHVIRAIRRTPVRVRQRVQPPRRPTRRPRP